MRFYCGLDLGQTSDPTAAAVLEKVPAKPQPLYHLRLLERPPLRTSYPAIVEAVKTLLASPPLKHNTRLVLDQTGCGRPVYDLFVQAGLSPVGITIVGTGEAHWVASNQWHVPKRDLVAVTKVLLQSGRLRVAEGLPLAPTFLQELLAFRLKVNIATGHESFEAWREGQHDDLVLAVCLAAWYAEKGPCLPFEHVKLPEGPGQTVQWPDGSIQRIARG